jgi:hypothetical protein
MMGNEREIGLGAWILTPILILVFLFYPLKYYKYLWVHILGFDLIYLGYAFLLIACVAITIGIITKTGSRRLSNYLFAFSCLLIALGIIYPTIFEL